MSEQTSPDPFLTVINLFKRLDDLVPVWMNPPPLYCCLTDHPSQASATPPLDGPHDEYTSFLLAVRLMRDTYFQKRGEISRELSAIQRATKLHETRLGYTAEALSAIEELLGEIRVRFRAKGISIVDSRYQRPYRISESTAVEPDSATELSADPAVPHANGVHPEVSACTS